MKRLQNKNLFLIRGVAKLPGLCMRKICVLQVMLVALSFLLTNCGIKGLKVAGCTGDCSSVEYIFPGIGNLVSNSDGTYTLSWEKPPTDNKIEFNIYNREELDNVGSGTQTSYNFTQPSAQIINEQLYKTPNLTFKNSTCYVVRFLHPDTPDTNTKEICTKHTKYLFPGIKTLTENTDKTWTLAWEKMPTTDVAYNIFARDVGGTYDLTTPIAYASSKDGAFTTTDLTFVGNKCYKVQAVSAGKIFTDTNTKELCTTNLKYSFAGIDSLTDNNNGTYTLFWSQPPSSDVVYKIFVRNSTGNYTLTTPIATNSFKDNSYITDNLTLTGSKCYLVRAISNSGLFTDTNTKEICTEHTPFAAFSGCTGYTIVDSTKIKVNFTWPTSATAMDILRDGVSVYTTENKADIIFNDAGLSNSRTYEYKCRAKVNGLMIAGTTAYNLRPFNADNLPSFVGCSSAIALSTSQIKVNFTWPSISGYTVSAMNIYRNGVLIKTENVTTNNYIEDFGLAEGFGYTYKCSATINGLEVFGTTVLSAETLSANPPSFAGLGTITSVSASSVQLAWENPTTSSIPVSTYAIYGNAGTTLNTAGAPLATLASTQLTYTATGLGEEIPYVFGVKACSSKGYCAWGLYNFIPQPTVAPLTANPSNASSVTKTNTIADSGIAPTTIGATAVVMGLGAAQVTAPWDATKGGLYKRHVYYKAGAAISSSSPPAACVTNIKDPSCYPNEVVFTVTDITSPPTTLTVSNLSDSSAYAFIVRDEDFSGHLNTNFNAVSLTSTGDTTAPIFNGGGTLSAGSPADTVISLDFAAIVSQSVNTTGASHYIIYMTSADGAGTPADPCTSGTELTQINSTGYADGQTITKVITELVSRKTYAVCVKARDNAGNISTTATKALPNITTKDLGVPSFIGVSNGSWDYQNSCLTLNWPISSASDLKEYKAYIYKNSTPGTVVSKTIAATNSANVSTYCVSGADLAVLGDLATDTVKVYMNACDDAFPSFGAQNCSAYTSANAISITVPDITPPANFGGITVLSASSPNISGALTVTWDGPSDNNWADYRGFKVYDVPCRRGVGTACPVVFTPSDLVLLKDCACAASGCGEHLISCQLTGLNSYARYAGFVRAYDSYGNQSAIGSAPFTHERRSDDTQKPSFTSSLSASLVSGANATCNTAGSGVCLGWSAATDNQYAGDSNILTYKIYRHTSTITFDGNDLPSNGALIATTTNAYYKDPSSGLTDNTTYYYTACAADAATTAAFANSAGLKCDKFVTNVTTTDNTAPIFSGVASLSQGSPADSVINVSFTAVTPQITNPNGVSHYILYTTYAAELGTPADPCTSGTEYVQLPSNSYANGAIVNTIIIGLTGRRTYAVCVKARDNNGNISATATSALPNIVTQDYTAPSFGGISSGAWNSGDGCLGINWTISSAADLKEYKAYVYKNGAPGTVVTKTIPATNSVNVSSACLLPTDLSLLGDLSTDTIKVFMNACDNAFPDFGTQNCSAYTSTSAVPIIVPDVTPPSGFPGIFSLGASNPLLDGALTVTWGAPASWTDYRGFKVYDVPCKRDGSPCASPTANDMVLLKNCSCTTSACPEHLLSCQVTGLTPYKRYSVFVRAYDDYGNLTNIGVLPSVQERLADDIQKPTFASGLTATSVTEATGTCAAGGAGMCMGWTAATDNQYSGDGNALTYKVYRHTATFTFDGNDYPTNGSLLATTTSTNYKDTTGTLGLTYYYTVCAEDAATSVSFANNAGKKCDKVVGSGMVPYVAPAEPTGQTATVNTDSQITLNWSSGGGTTTGYRISYQLGATAPANCALGTTISEASISGTSKAVFGLTAATQYSFRICAINANVPPTASVGVTVTATTLQAAPPNPTDLTAIVNSSSQITLTWVSGGGVTADYRISYQTGASAPATCAAGTTISDTLINGTSHLVASLAPATQYSFRVCAINANPTPIVSTGITISATTISAFDVISANIGILKYVPAGTFQRDATPSNTSTVSFALNMSEYEITQTQFTAVTGLANPSYFPEVTGGPVEQINWYHAIVFCNKLSQLEGLTPVYTINLSTDPATWIASNGGSVPTTSNATWDAATANWSANGYRLPTEMEWMWAAMGANYAVSTTGYTKAFAGDNLGGNVIGNYAWYNTNAASATHAVGGKLANELGLFDMSGNVLEWTWDWYAASYPGGSLIDFKGAAPGTYRVTRGGSWNNNASGETVANVVNSYPYQPNNSIGFRVVRLRDSNSTNIGALKYVPPGTFQRDATSTNTSTISSAFYMSQYEITVPQFTSVTGLANPSGSFTGVSNGPVQNTDWYHAIVFCNKLSILEGLTPVYTISSTTDPAAWIAANSGVVPTSSNPTWDAATANWSANGYRLPTEMEWMWAAMGATYANSATGYTKTFAGDNLAGNLIGNYVWYTTNSGATTHTVATKLSNELGIFDLSGNVWEWNWDWYNASYPTGAVSDYKGAASGTDRVRRGGSWSSAASFASVAYRNGNAPAGQYNHYGFRVVRSPP